MSETTPRERLISQVAFMRDLVLIRDTTEPVLAAAGVAWKDAEAYVAAMEAEPEKPRECPCCTKLVVCCMKHYLLHEPGKKCVTCWDEE